MYVYNILQLWITTSLSARPLITLNIITNICEEIHAKAEIAAHLEHQLSQTNAELQRIRSELDTLRQSHAKVDAALQSSNERENRFETELSAVQRDVETLRTQPETVIREKNMARADVSVKQKKS